MDDDVRRDEGMTTRRAVLGDAHVDRVTASTTEFTERFQNFITRYAWGEVWSDPVLDRRTRSALTVSLLAALGHHEELAMHVLAARRNGLTDAEISAVLQHTAIYAGVPAANAAFRVAQRALEDVDGRD